jgi:hypothetical protein
MGKSNKPAAARTARENLVRKIFISASFAAIVAAPLLSHTD